jgi:DNA-binding CsgD family transcriptional regulator
MTDGKVKAVIAKFKDRRIRILFWKCKGLTYEEIAEILDIASTLRPKFVTIR